MRSRTALSSLPLLRRTWNAWSASSIETSVARSPRRSTSARTSAGSASSSRVPWKKSIGRPTRSRCSPRSLPGCFGGCSGKPMNTKPRTPASAASASACDVIRPPNDLPPAKSGRPGQRAFAAATAARTAA
jgi:hypothetical protein